MFLQYPSEYIHSLGGQRDGAVPAQAVQYFGRRQPFSLLVISGNAEIVVEQLLFGRYLFEIVVVFRHNPFVRLVEPIAFAVVQFVHGLGIKLVVVYRAVGVYCFRHFYADEPATAAGVGQQVLLVAGGDERGVSAHLEHGIGVWLAHVDHRLLEDMFQESLLGAAYLVEFIDVDERKTVEVKFSVTLAREVDAVRIIGTQLGRDDASAKGALRVPCAPTNKGETLLAYFLSVLPRQCATMLRNQRWNSSAQYGLLQGTVWASARIRSFPSQCGRSYR